MSASWLMIDMEPTANLIVKTSSGLVTFQGTKSFKFEPVQDKAYLPKRISLLSIIGMLRRGEGLFRGSPIKEG